MIALGGLCATIPMTGCTELIRWGDEWKTMPGPIEAWGKEIVGYRDVY